MKLYISIPAVVAAGLLSACSEVSQIDAGLGLLETVTAAGVDFDIGTDDLPDSASMTGNIAFATEDTAWVGDASVEANFAAGTMLGSADNFNEYALDALACVAAPATCESTLTRSMDGGLIIVGGIEDTFFEYYAFGGLTAEDNAYTAEVYLGGEGEFGLLEDGTLVALGAGGGDVYLYSIEGGGEEDWWPVYLGQEEVYSGIVLSE